ncbi:MAG TPA: 5-formyltetrahydrofolate cyclo-ligase [Balneolaceae bacterium]|nr:5-formyltetrahydrofolate cyclo-ligase [Balneolaceae bacterium]
MAVQRQKEQIRKRLLDQRQAISFKEWETSSKIIIEKLKQLSIFRAAKTVHCYVSINERREVNTHPLIKEMIAGEKKVIISRTKFADESLSHFELHSFDDLSPNKWGVLEPVKGEKAVISEIDLVIVPMVGGDEKCNRIGYGGGFYDRFLKDVFCSKVGLCFEQNIIEKLPIEPFDIPLDMIVTEGRIIGVKV